MYCNTTGMPFLNKLSNSETLHCHRLADTSCVHHFTPKTERLKVPESSKIQPISKQCATQKQDHESYLSWD